MGRKGAYLERELERVISHLSTLGIHGHKNHVKRTAEGQYLEGEPFDYEVFVNGTVHCFDAKECRENLWSLKNAKPSQVNALLQCAAHGAEAYFLVWFEKGGLRRFDAAYVKAALTSGKKSLSADEGRPWDWEKLISDKSRKSTT